MKSNTNIPIFVIMLVLISCSKEQIENKKTQSPTNLSVENMKELSSIKRGIDLGIHFKRKNSSFSKYNNVYSVDSALYYLTISINSQKADANSYNYSNESFAYNYILEQMPTSFTETELDQIYDIVTDTIDSRFDQISTANRVIHSISIDLISNEDMQPILHFYVTIGYKNYETEDISDITKAYITMWPNNISYRYNWNGGLCNANYADGTPYYAPRDHAHGIFEDDVPPFVHGFPTGGSFEIERAINITHAWRQTMGGGLPSYGQCKKAIKIVRRYGPSGSAHIKRVNPWDYPISNSSQNPYFPNNNHNPTRVFSYFNWNNTLYGTMPCLTGAMMNHYLNEYLDIIDLEKPNLSYSQGWHFGEVAVYDGYKRYVVFPSNPSVEMDLNGGTPNAWGGTNYYEYFNHNIRIFEARTIVIDDPACQ